MSTTVTTLFFNIKILERIETKKATTGVAFGGYEFI